MGRALQSADRVADGPRCRRRRLSGRAAGLEWVRFVLAAQRRFRALRHRDVLPAAVSADASGGRGGAVGMTTVTSPPPESTHRGSSGRAKRDIWITYWIFGAFYTVFSLGV